MDEDHFENAVCVPPVENMWKMRLLRGEETSRVSLTFFFFLFSF